MFRYESHGGYAFGPETHEEVNVGGQVERTAVVVGC